MSLDLKVVIAANVRKLLDLEPSQPGATAALIARGISNGDATRILKGQTSVGLDKLAELAAALDVEPWQLCVPGLDPSAMPTLAPMSFRWPFRQIDPEVVLNLVGTTAQNVENGLVAVLTTAGVATRKPGARAAW